MSTNSFPQPPAKMLPFSLAEIEGSIPARFEYVARQVPDHLAVNSEHGEYTYFALNQSANRLAGAILSRQGEQPGAAALLLPHGASLIMAILAVLKAGKFYTSLAPADPSARLASILKDVQAQLLVTNSRFLPLAQQIIPPRCLLFNLDDISQEISGEDAVLELSPNSPAGVFYTSGSTGQPKGVLRNHRIILQRAWFDSETYSLTPQDRTTLLTPISFGASAADIFSTLLNGASLFLLDIRENGFSNLPAWLKEKQITLFRAPVALFRHFMDDLDPNDSFPSVRWINIGTDVLYKKDVERLRQHFSPACLLLQRFSSSETGPITQLIVDSQLEISGLTVPVGYPVPGREVLILDERGQPAGPNQSGEIAVRSRFLADGYFGNDDLTSQKFTPDPHDPAKRIYLTGDLGRLSPDGCLEFLGRKDFMVKIRGFRVELSAVEGALLNLPQVRSAAVLATTDSAGEKHLAAYIVPASSASQASPALGGSSQPLPAVGELRTALAQTLPDFMLPEAYIFLDELPLTPRGKVDRQALLALKPPQSAPSETYLPARNDLEEQLTRIWEEVLNRHPIGVLDNFFDLGGQSLAAARILARVAKICHIDLTLPDLLKSPTITGLASAIQQHEASCSSPGIKPIRRSKA